MEDDDDEDDEPTELEILGLEKKHQAQLLLRPLRDLGGVKRTLVMGAVAWQLHARQRRLPRGRVLDDQDRRCRARQAL